jgi:hypothetical protein
MKKSILTQYQWHNISDPQADIILENEECLHETATSHIDEMVEQGFNRGELSTNPTGATDHYQCTWSVSDVSRPQDLYRLIVQGMKEDLANLIIHAGVDSTHVKDLKVLDISDYELVLAGELITAISKTRLYTPYGVEFNHCLLEVELERVLEVIEDLQTL